MDIDNVVSQFQLWQSNVLEFSFNNNELIIANDNDIKRVFDVDYSVIYIDERDGFRIGAVELTVSVTRSHNTIDNEFRLNIRLNGVYTAPNTVPLNTFQSMLELNGVTALYSLARGRVSALSSLCYPSEPIDLPMINIARLVDEKHKNKPEE